MRLYSQAWLPVDCSCLLPGMDALWPASLLPLPLLPAAMSSLPWWKGLLAYKSDFNSSSQIICHRKRSSNKIGDVHGCLVSLTIHLGEPEVKLCGGTGVTDGHWLRAENEVSVADGATYSMHWEYYQRTKTRYQDLWENAKVAVSKMPREKCVIKAWV